MPSQPLERLSIYVREDRSLTIVLHPAKKRVSSDPSFQHRDQTHSTAQVTADQLRVDGVKEKDGSQRDTPSRVKVRHPHRASAAGSLSNPAELLQSAALHPNLLIADHQGLLGQGRHTLS